MESRRFFFVAHVVYLWFVYSCHNSFSGSFFHLIKGMGKNHGKNSHLRRQVPNARGGHVCSRWGPGDLSSRIKQTCCMKEGGALQVKLWYLKYTKMSCFMALVWFVSGSFHMDAGWAESVEGFDWREEFDVNPPSTSMGTLVTRSGKIDLTPPKLLAFAMLVGERVL